MCPAAPRQGGFSSVAFWGGGQERDDVCSPFE